MSENFGPDATEREELASGYARVPGNEHSCYTCDRQMSCQLILDQPVLRERHNVSTRVPLPMPCGGDLWVLRTKQRRSRRAFAMWNPNARPDPEAKPVSGSLDTLELP